MMNRTFPPNEKTEDIPNYDELYIALRSQEIKNNIISKHNYSGYDVLPLYKWLREIKIMKSLNLVDTVIWVKGILGIQYVFRK